MLQAGVGQIPSRQVSVGDRPARPTVGSETINKVCASGMRAATLGDVLIRAGEHDVMLAGGMESMSNAPYLLPKARFGYTFGDGALVDSMTSDGLTSHVRRPDHGRPELAACRPRSASPASRAGRVGAAQPRARRSPRSTPASWPTRSCRSTIPGRKGDTVVDTDEGPRRDTSAERLAALTPVFSTDGATTAGNAPGVNDGAAALVLASEDWAARARSTSRWP